MTETVQATSTLFERFIATAYYGGSINYGYGESIDEAKKNCQKASYTKKKLKFSISRFTSELPFAPTNRPPTEDESDAWFASDLCLHWTRCERTIIE